MRGMSLLKMALGVGVLALCSCTSIGGWVGKIEGRADARKDLQEGKLVREVMGPPPAPWVETYQQFLKERYGIENRWVAGCMVSDRVVGHATSYNEIMEAEIDRRFGKGVLDKTADEAKKKTPPPRP